MLPKSVETNQPEANLHFTIIKTKQKAGAIGPRFLFGTFWKPLFNYAIVGVDCLLPLHKLKAISQLNERLKKLTPDQIAALDKPADELGEG
jgi:hypothetical protein